MDIASLVGIVLCFGMLAFGILNATPYVNRYLDLPSAIITFGGAFFAVMTSKSMAEYIEIGRAHV